MKWLSCVCLPFPVPFRYMLLCWWLDKLIPRSFQGGQWAATRPALGHSWEPLRDGMPGPQENPHQAFQFHPGTLTFLIPWRQCTISQKNVDIQEGTASKHPLLLHSKIRRCIFQVQGCPGHSSHHQQSPQLLCPSTDRRNTTYRVSTTYSALRTVFWAADAFLIVIPLDLLPPGPNSGILGFTLKEQSCDYCLPIFCAIIGTELPTRYQELEKAWGCWHEHPSKGSQWAPSYPRSHSLLPGLLTEPPQLLSSVSHFCPLISQYNSSKA